MSFSCLNCGRHFNTSQGLDSHCDAKYHNGVWECCGRNFYSCSSWEQHSTFAASHRTCDICNLIYGSVEAFERHWKKKHTSKKPKFVNCNFCDRQFKSPSAYAQHIESGIHSVSRYQVTQAVHTLRVIPQITILPTLEYNTTSRIEAFEDAPAESDFVPPVTPTQSTNHHSAGCDCCSPSETPEITTHGPVEPGPVLSARGEETTVVPTVEPPVQAPTTVTVVPARRFGPDRLEVAQMPTTYVPGDFVNQGIPYACPICLKTFRNVFALSSHMNSPVHDPDAFMCPKCNRHFRLVSGLIQHLESGCCKLASPAEIYDRFAKLTANFSRLLTA